MFKKFFIFLFFFHTVLFAETFTQDDFLQIVAKTVTTTNEIVNAKGNVVVYSPKYYITATKLIYDKKNLKLELFGDVSLVKEDELITFSQYLFIDIKKDLKMMKPIILIDNGTKLWFNSKSAKVEKDQYNLEVSTLSSCDCKDPSWSISFESGDYNTKKQWVNTYHTKLYINNIPILYTPYFGFPTDKTRRTGLLRPTIGYSENEGFLYAQPIYYAPKDNFDFEYIPQTRAHRGYGHALKYRYTDSLYSILKIEAGQFNEKKEYQDKFNLVNEKHYGWDLEYKRTKLFSTDETSDGLIIKSIDMNDVDYINTRYDNDANNYTDKFLESQIKYFYTTNQYYFDIDARLYNDISQDNNDNVVQNLPTLNAHKYSDSLFIDKLTSSFDITTSRKTRKIGLAGDTTSIYAPINYHYSLFNDYVNIDFSEQINYKNIQYKNNNDQYENVNYGTNNHQISLYTDLMKPYENYLHTFKLNTTFTKQNVFKEDGDIYNINTNDSNLSIFSTEETKQNISLGVNQSVYDRDNLKQLFNHKLNQLYIYDDEKGKYERDNLENDLSIFYQYGTINNRLLYNHKSKKVVSSSSTFSFLNNNYFLNAYHTNKYIKDDTTDQYLNEEEEDIKYELGLNFLKYYKLSYSEEYDLSNNITKKKQYQFDIDKKCWGVNLKLIDALVATNTTDDSILRQDILYIEFNFKQLFKIDQNYKLKEKGTT